MGYPSQGSRGPNGLVVMCDLLVNIPAWTLVVHFQVIKREELETKALG